MIFRLLFSIVLASLFTSCAQVPPSSVTLSHSIADDVASMQNAHRDFVNYYFDNLEQQANKFIDDFYRPRLIQQVIEQDVAKFKDPAKKQQSLFNAIQEAFVSNKGLSAAELQTSQSNAMAGMQIFYSTIDRKVQQERGKLISPLRQQRQELLSDLEKNYTNIIKKNAAITALLSSVVDVHETQQEILSIAGIDKNLREEAATRLAGLSDKLADMQAKVEDGSAKVGDIEEAINKFKQKIGRD